MAVEEDWVAQTLSMIDQDEVVANIRRHSEDAAWIGENREQLCEQHPDRFIAVYDRKVIAVGDALADALTAAAEAGFDPAQCVLEVMVTEELIWVL